MTVHCAFSGPMGSRLIPLCPMARARCPTGSNCWRSTNNKASTSTRARASLAGVVRLWTTGSRLTYSCSTPGAESMFPRKLRDVKTRGGNLRHDEPQMDRPGASIGAVVGIGHQQPTPPRDDGLVVGAVMSQDLRANVRARPLKECDAAGNSRMRGRVALRHGRIAGVFLLGDQYVGSVTVPGAHTDLVDVTIVRADVVRDPGIGRRGGLFVPDDAPFIGGTSGALMLVGRADDTVPGR